MSDISKLTRQLADYTDLYTPEKMKKAVMTKGYSEQEAEAVVQRLYFGVGEEHTPDAPSSTPVKKRERGTPKLSEEELRTAEMNAQAVAMGKTLSIKKQLAQMEKAPKEKPVKKKRKIPPQLILILVVGLIGGGVYLAFQMGLIKLPPQLEEMLDPEKLTLIKGALSGNIKP